MKNLIILALLIVLYLGLVVETVAQSNECPTPSDYFSTDTTPIVRGVGNATKNYASPNEGKKQRPIVFGSNRCGWTKLYLKEFDTFGIQYDYRDLANKSVEEELWKTLEKANYVGSGVDLPVIVDNGKPLVRPDLIPYIKANYPSKLSVPSQAEPINIYSTKNNQATNRYIEALDEIGLKYSIKDIQEPANNKEFFRIAKAQGLGNEVKVPAIVVDGKVHIAPTLSQTITLLKK